MPRHPPYALINLTTIFPKLMSYEILMFFIKLLIFYIIKFSKNKMFERNNLSKPSKNLSTSNFTENFSLSCYPRSSLTVLRFYFLHRKEVIHPHVLVGIPCYDFTPVTCPTLGGPLPYGLGYRLQVLQTPMAWRAVCTTPGNVFTPTFWFGITSDSNFMESSCRLQSGLRPTFRD